MANRRKKLSKRGIILLAALALLVLLFVLSLILFRPGSDGGVIELSPYALDSSSAQRFAVMDGDLAVASGGGLQIFDENGSLISRRAVTLLSPALAASDQLAAACDIGGTTLVTMNRKGESQLYETENPLISVDVTDDGWLAVSSESPGYRGMVTVYDQDHNLIYEWFSGEDYVLGAALSEDHLLAVLCAGSSGARVHIFSMNSEEERGFFAAPELMFDLFWTGSGHLAALSDQRLVLLDDQGVQTTEYAFGGLHLFDYSTGGDGLTTLALSAYRTGGACTLVTIGASGKVLAERTVENVTGIDAHGKQILVRSGAVLTLFNQQLEDMRALDFDPLGVRQALLLKNGRALLIYDYSCSVTDI
jgi:hypothetical protein